MVHQQASERSPAALPPALERGMGLSGLRLNPLLPTERMAARMLCWNSCTAPQKVRGGRGDVAGERSKPPASPWPQKGALPAFQCVRGRGSRGLVAGVAPSLPAVARSIINRRARPFPRRRKGAGGGGRHRPCGTSSDKPWSKRCVLSIMSMSFTMQGAMQSHVRCIAYDVDAFHI
jgi:hypothetical protein